MLYVLVIWFNLAVQQYLERYNSVITNIQQIMVLLSTLKKAGRRLIQLIDLEPVTMNRTRWSSKHDMLERFFRLEEYIKEMDDYDLNVPLPSGRELAELKIVREHLCDFNLITKKLQDPSISLLDVRVIFDEVISSYPSMNCYLAKDADIVINPFFESAICKLLLNQHSLLSCEERSAVLPLVQTVEPDKVETPGTVVERAVKTKNPRKSMG
jgi:hypothetical protein